KYIGFAGTFFEHQGIDTLIDAAPQIVKQFPDTYFVLVGDGPMKEAWKNKIAEMGLSSYFIFTGQVEYQDVPLYLGVMDICVAPLIQQAGSRSPVKVFDYLSCGRPVVMSDVANTGELFKSSGAVVLIQPEDRVSLSENIIQLLENEAICEKMGKKGREFVLSKYDRKKLAKTVGSIAHRLSFLS
ncbi:glycosyltransferase, partial [Thermodesulfobacteriota bacterium]